MIRTLISLEKEDKEWLSQFSNDRGQSVSETVRQAIRHFMESVPQRREEICSRAAGLWAQHGVDGLEYQENIRKEWSDRT